MKNTPVLLLFCLLLNSPLVKSNTVIHIGQFSQGKLDQWETKVFSGSTFYQLTNLESTQVLKAESNSTASGLFKQQRIDLKKTPFLNWRWRIDNRLSGLNEQSKSGDDYTARVYVVIDGGWAFWKTQAINYVWASNSPKNIVWPNAFAGKNAMMIAVRSSKDKTHTWYKEKRNIMEDLKQQFGTDMRYIDVVAIMTDTDNGQGKATAYYGDIFFSSQ